MERVSCQVETGELMIGVTLKITKISQNILKRFKTNGAILNQT